ncbi:MAG: hypothetical protein KAI29_20170, partial [Cyclobacteriaceae bacterium]|nr:hypothetical protein [Cyclobacteriaceae bacterium]MCK5703490.1 hypothetical protein [Cyclobacteriaceae bacterium]
MSKYFTEIIGLALYWNSRCENAFLPECGRWILKGEVSQVDGIPTLIFRHYGSVVELLNEH